MASEPAEVQPGAMAVDEGGSAAALVAAAAEAERLGRRADEDEAAADAAIARGMPGSGESGRGRSRSRGPACSQDGRPRRRQAEGGVVPGACRGHIAAEFLAESMATLQRGGLSTVFAHPHAAPAGGACSQCIGGNV